MATKQFKLVEKYFSFFGCSIDRITALQNDTSVTFIITCTNFSFVNLIPKFKPDDISIFHNNIRIKFIKTIENGK